MLGFKSLNFWHIMNCKACKKYFIICNIFSSYISPELVVTEAVEVKIGSSEDHFHNVGNDRKLLKKPVLGGDSQTLDDSANCHRDVCKKEHEAHHEQKSHQTLIPPRHFVVFKTGFLLEFPYFSQHFLRAYFEAGDFLTIEDCHFIDDYLIM